MNVFSALYLAWNRQEIAMKFIWSMRQRCGVPRSHGCRRHFHHQKWVAQTLMRTVRRVTNNWNKELHELELNNHWNAGRSSQHVARQWRHVRGQPQRFAAVRAAEGATRNIETTFLLQFFALFLTVYLVFFDVVRKHP